ncbi:PREDICTED: suppressor protein SRP40 [Polistes dominula]|uniref:Suppressor protein SRP40 n=1 Tax=Polistes dominula TaxID=743375 RepID=A0ABM1IT26_POLDO|nr:PREDICTED: suppressor protein SRP40 [Polistes dominula]
MVIPGLDTMEPLSNELVKTPDLAQCCGSEDDVDFSRYPSPIDNENSPTAASERVRQNFRARTWQICFREIVPTKMILTNSGPLNSGPNVPPTPEFLSNDETKTESTLLSDSSDSSSSCEIIFNDSTELNNEEGNSEFDIYGSDDNDDNDTETSDDDSEENDSCSSSSSSSENESDSESEDDSIENTNECNCRRRTTKKVTFDLSPVVHTMFKWDYAYRAARKGPWEEMARDRCRFNGRINNCHLILSPVLQDDHRVRVWTERFS